MYQGCCISFYRSGDQLARSPTSTIGFRRPVIQNTKEFPKSHCKSRVQPQIRRSAAGRGWRPGNLPPGAQNWVLPPLGDVLVTVLRNYFFSTSNPFFSKSDFEKTDFGSIFFAFGDFEQICSGHAGTKNFPGTRRGTRDHKK